MRENDNDLGFLNYMESVNYEEAGHIKRMLASNSEQGRGRAEKEGRERGV